ncbi:MAG: DUF4340 domain-containing protein [Clostridiales bacterium]|nr:DUF4340 domain-containing protein [Clostridiales bacterium]
MSSKQYKLIAILIAVIVVFTAAYFIIDKRVTKKETEQFSSTPIINIFNFDTSNITDLLIINSDGEFDFAMENNNWVSKSSEQFKFNPYMLNDIANYMSSLQAIEIIVESANDLSLYGLDSPKSIITCTTSDSNKYILEVGNESITKDSYYVKKQGENTIYSINYAIGSVFNTSRESLKEIYLFDSLLSDVISVSLEHEGTIAYDVTKSDSLGWIMNEPLYIERTNVAKLSGMIDTIIRINIANFIQEDLQDYTDYGFDNPSYILEINARNKSEKILFGDMINETGEIYALFNSTKDVVTFYRSQLSFLDVTAEQMIVDTIHTENIYDVSKVEIMADGEITTLIINANANDIANAKYSYNDININALGDDAVKLFIDFYSSIAGVYFDHIDINTQPDISIEPKISFIYTRKSEPETVTVSFIPKSENTFYAMIDGEYTGFIVRLKAFHEDKGLYKTQEALVRFIDENK